jgi:sterol desaturase/sphingolipid hydroxylase (fatty acid hydroxylase superfamily)
MSVLFLILKISVTVVLVRLACSRRWCSPGAQWLRQSTTGRRPACRWSISWCASIRCAWLLPLAFWTDAMNWFYGSTGCGPCRWTTGAAGSPASSVQEFCYYWYHRAAHRVRWFWCTHAIHHSPNQLNLSAAYRFGWTGKLTGTLLFFMLAPLLGMPPKVILLMLTLNLLYQFWIHATWIPRLGPLEWFLNTPSAHRVHHASNLEYLDGNYGGVLTVFDRLFGTYIPERADLPCRYGLVNPVTSYNLFEIEFMHWRALLRDLRSARSVRAFVGYLFKPPGWRPDGPGETTEELRQRAALQPKPVLADAPLDAGLGIERY